MDAAATLLQLQTSGFSVNRDGQDLLISPAEKITPELAGTIKAHKVELLALLDEHAERRRQRVLKLIWSNPRLQYAVYSDDATTDPVMVAVAIRKSTDRVISLEVAIPKARYDGMALLGLVEKWGSTKGPELAVIPGGKLEPEAA